MHPFSTLGMEFLARRYPLHRQRILECMTEQGKAWEILNDPPFDLDCLFSWVDTTEGWEYWFNLGGGTWESFATSEGTRGIAQ